MVIYMVYALLTCAVPTYVLGTFLLGRFRRIHWLLYVSRGLSGMIAIPLLCILLLLSGLWLYLLYVIISSFAVNARIRVSFKFKLESTIICRIHGLV